MIKRMLIMIALLAALGAGFFFYKVHAMKTGMAQMQASFKPPAVSTIKAETKDWQPQLHAVGSLRAINGADLSSELAGIVADLSFESGTDVEKGAALVRLRDDDDIAKLKSLEATAKLAQITVDRDEKQLKAQAISQATLDSDTATLNSARAQVDEQQAIIDKKTIRAPFAGHLGIRQVDVGQYLNPGAAIVTLQQLDPIYVDFSLPEDSLPRLALEQKVSLSADAFPDQNFTGKIAAINAKVDESTRNIMVRATFDNPDHKLLPGMFARVTVDSGKPEHYVTLPQAAIVFNTYGNTVYLVNNDSDKGPTAHQSVVEIGETRGDEVAVLSGVKEGDEVVTSGQVKLRNDSPIRIFNDKPAPNDADPKPHED